MTGLDLGLLFLGHLVGDYIFQNDWMAVNKSKHTLVGWLACTVHCLVYSVAVCLVMQRYDPVWFGIVFASHFFFDKFSLAEIWLTFIRGKSFTRLGRFQDSPHARKSPFLGIITAYTVFVYAVTDNAFHLVLMTIGLHFITR